MNIQSTKRQVRTASRVSRPETQATDIAPPNAQTIDRVELGSDSSNRAWNSSIELIGTLSQGQPEGLKANILRLLETQTPDGGWPEFSEESKGDHNTAILNHTALATYLRRGEHADEYRAVYSKDTFNELTSDEPLQTKLEKALKRSWRFLHGEPPAEHQDFLGALPKAVIREHASDGVAKFHEALLGDSVEVRLEPEQSLKDALKSLKAERSGELVEYEYSTGLGKSLLTLGLVGGGLAAAASAGMLGEVGLLAAGAVAGWTVSSLMESVVHDKVLHAPDLPISGRSVSEDKGKSLTRQVYDRSPEFLQKSIDNNWFSHTKIHHFRTFRQDHATKFRDEAEEARLNKYLIKKGKEQVIEDEHGMTMSWKAYRSYQLVASPAYAAAIGAATALGAGPLFAAGFAAPALLYPLFSMSYHRYTHMNGKEAMETAPTPIKQFLKTDMSRHVVRHHFVHHEDEFVNFNLMPGGDWLRGTSERPSVAQEEEMRRLGLLW